MITMAKVKKAFLKRFKITKKGRILRRIAGQSHCFAKKDKPSLYRKKRLKEGAKIFLDYKNY